MSEPDDEEWPCRFRAEVSALGTDPATNPDLFSAVAALSVRINQTRGEVPQNTAPEQWPQQRRIPLGPAARRRTRSPRRPTSER